MISLLEAAVVDAADRTAVVTPESSPSYAELLEDSRRVAASLRRRGTTRFAVAEPDVAWVIRLLAGAALAGAEPCQYQPDTDAGILRAETAALEHHVLVTRRADVGGGSPEVVRPEELLAEMPERGADVDPPDGDQPLIIRTTGTTGSPKAARHDWRVLGQTVEKVEPRPDQRWLLAYGPQQFAGIQVMLHVLASRATLVAPFPRQPRDGLDAILSEGITCVSATPTYWRFLLAEARSRRLRLPSLEQITLGGEASPPDLLGELRATFPMARVSQVYASTEFGSITSVNDGLPGISIGSLWSASNPTSNVRAENGELWVRAEAGMLGYAGDTGEDGTVGDPPSSTAWRPTGDLIEIVGTRVLFRGRQSEIINVGGVKVHPLPVEERVLALDSVGAARVFGRPSKLTGAIVAVEIVPAASGVDADTVRRAVRDAVADLPRAWQPRSITIVDALETRGGKTVRGTEDE